MTDTRAVLSRFSDQLDVLAHPERLTLLLALRDAPPDESIRRTGDEVNRRSVGRAQQVRMYHVHLPKLDDIGVVDWDREADTIRRGPNFAETEPILDVLGSRRDDLPGESGHR